jgi:cytidylate kinase
VSIITISRGTLSGGRTTAMCLADQLGYPCVGREILQAAARKAGASAEVLKHEFEAPPGRLSFQPSPQRMRYLLAVQAALADRCVDGDLVYHGLAGQFLLKDLAGVLRVRLIAPMDMRIRALTAAHHRTAPKAAEKYIERADRDRRRWVRHMYGVDVGEPSLYDLTINLHVISLETACAIIADLASQPQYRVTDDVRAELKAFAEDRQQELAALDADTA